MTTGYIYQTEQEAQNAVELCNQYYGIPHSPDDITTSYTSYLYSSGNNFYYIIYDPTLEIVLGSPETFEIIYNITGSTENYVGS
jgi:hypothetical protein